MPKNINLKLFYCLFIFKNFKYIYLFFLFLFLYLFSSFFFFLSLFIAFSLSLSIYISIYLFLFLKYLFPSQSFSLLLFSSFFSLSFSPAKPVVRFYLLLTSPYLTLSIVCSLSKFPQYQQLFSYSTATRYFSMAVCPSNGPQIRLPGLLRRLGRSFYFCVYTPWILVKVTSN